MNASSSEFINRTAPTTKGRPAPLRGIDGAPSPFLTPGDLESFAAGTHARLFEKLGAHRTAVEEVEGVYFAVWAPGASAVSVVGDFNGWAPGATPMGPRADSGIWEAFAPDIEVGARYRYHITSRHNDEQYEKADPFANWSEVPPATASRVWDDDYAWSDSGWMTGRSSVNTQAAPISIYEVHLGSWRTHDDGRPLNYREMAQPLIEHLRALHFTHVEFLPVMEHPFGGSWGYQSLGFFGPTARFGSPADLAFLVDSLHQAGFGVVLDWVPSHFAVDDHGLARFDGWPLYEHPDPRRGFQPDWGTYIFDYERPEVRSFLLSSAVYWLDRFHIDGLRVDAVASMLYLDYSRNPGEWIPNEFGGNENLDAIAFLRGFNEIVHAAYPDAITLAEESTAWPGVTSPTYVGGLGFDFKWDMGWMHDTLKYLERDPVHRQHHHNEITFRAVYAFTENYILPLSHDEVVHLKKSLLEKMPGDDWQRFANLRLLLADQFAQPGKKLLFMGGEFGQRTEWSEARQLDWDLLQHAPHAGIMALVGELAEQYRTRPSLYGSDHVEGGFEWVDANDAQRSTLAFTRKAGDDEMLILLNFTPEPRSDYPLPGGAWRVVLNSDEARFGGSGMEATVDESSIMLPPLAAVWLLKE